MNKQERQEQQKRIIDGIKGIEKMTGDIVKVLGEHSKAMQILSGQKNTYTPEYIKQETEKAGAALAGTMSKMRESMADRLGNLRELFRARDAIDFSDPSLSNAIMFIKTMGDNLTHEQALQVNKAFAHDLSSLRALQTVYESVTFNGDIDTMIYDPEAMIDKLDNAISNLADGKGSVYSFVSQLSKLAEFQGASIDAGLSGDAFGDALFRGAQIGTPQA